MKHVMRITAVPSGRADTLAEWWDLFREQLDAFWRTDIKKEVAG